MKIACPIHPHAADPREDQAAELFISLPFEEVRAEVGEHVLVRPDRRERLRAMPLT